ncbi:hypothetical protein JHK82_034097 [Glycine max]|nr:hypothetical protein JHK87_034027 [Glycine soja]KAG4980849.1 hypothetical protein JHK85_034807 [Glycine max]KAG4986476.1 hypothetical protein JHK86_034167 [Glycine max]KAG5119677.1 hypothetical protein JHK82_034097 [Glycine max]KAG5140666.1 hypothetical protein JHK84_034434 [Glycine max]
MWFLVAIHSMGYWVMQPTLKWEGKKENAFHELDIDTWSFLEVVVLIHDIEYDVTDGLKMWWKGANADYEILKDLNNDHDAMDLVKYSFSHKCEVDIYVKFGVSQHE